MRILFLIACTLSAFTVLSQRFTTRFEQSGGRETGTYQEVITWWKQLDAAYGSVKMMEMGPTDAGYPLHLVLVSSDQDFNMASARKKNKAVILVNNGIHPGEPDGIDASMILVRNIVQKKFTLPANVLLAIIPVYNIGGALNRSPDYRIDQNGPEVKGFRGNSQNLDLNRDFIKADAKETLTFHKIFHFLDPDVFIDNHVSNGADYQHVMTLITTQHNKLGGAAGAFIHQVFEPALYASMKTKGWDLVPYVNHFGDTPEKGWTEFFDSPRYASGYAALWNTFAFVPETHMLKPYEQRVAATRALMESFIEFTAKNSHEITRIRREAVRLNQVRDSFPIAWKNDRSKFSNIEFKGYQSGQKPSAVSGLPRLYYDRNKPFTEKVPFYNFYRDTLTVDRPMAYLIPQGWWKVIERLRANKVRMMPLQKDTTIMVEWYAIEGYESAARPYEGHHPNSKTRVVKKHSAISFRKGDFFIPLNQRANRFLVETLEPHAEDSYFTWNFFDPVLGQKEGFSSYVFEETAAAYLTDQPDVLAALEQRRATDSTFNRNAYAQLNFVYRNSRYFEPAYLRYPVYRVK